MTALPPLVVPTPAFVRQFYTRYDTLCRVQPLAGYEPKWGTIGIDRDDAGVESLAPALRHLVPMIVQHTHTHPNRSHFRLTNVQPFYNDLCSQILFFSYGPECFSIGHLDNSLSFYTNLVAVGSRTNNIHGMLQWVHTWTKMLESMALLFPSRSYFNTHLTGIDWNEASMSLSYIEGFLGEFSRNPALKLDR